MKSTNNIFNITVLCNVIGLAIWTHEICNGSFSKEHFSGEHCSNFNWNFSYFAGSFILYKTIYFVKLLSCLIFTYMHSKMVFVYSNEVLEFQLFQN